MFQTNAMVMRGLGGPEVLEYRPLLLNWDPSGDRVLVRLVAAGVNPADMYFRGYGPYIGTPEGCVLGHDGAGIVQAVGLGVTGLAVGDRVWRHARDLCRTCRCAGRFGGQGAGRGFA